MPEFSTPVARVDGEAGRGGEARGVAGLQEGRAADNAGNEVGLALAGRDAALLIGLCLAGIGALAYTKLARRWRA